VRLHIAVRTCSAAVSDGYFQEQSPGVVVLAHWERRTGEHRCDALATEATARVQHAERRRLRDAARAEP
jgi:hypothetical protein